MARVVRCADARPRPGITRDLSGCGGSPAGLGWGIASGCGSGTLPRGGVPAMHVETPVNETQTHENNEPVQAPQTEWVTPDFVEQATCAEICAYVFTA